MLLLGAAQHCVNESRVMANAASRRLGVPCALPGCRLAPQGWLRPRGRRRCRLPWLGPVRASPAAGWTWRDEGLAGFGLLERGERLLPRDVSFPGTSSSQGHLPADDTFPGTSPCWGCLLPGDDIFPGMSLSRGHLLPGDICFPGTSSWEHLLPRDDIFPGTSPSQAHLLPGDHIFPKTSSEGCLLPEDISFPGASPGTHIFAGGGCFPGMVQLAFLPPQ